MFFNSKKLYRINGSISTETLSETTKFHNIVEKTRRKTLNSISQFHKLNMKMHSTYLIERNCSNYWEFIKFVANAVNGRQIAAIVINYLFYLFVDY